MKATLQFNLPLESYEMECAYKSVELSKSIIELDTYLRNKLKYSDKLSDLEILLLEDVRLQLATFLAENRCDFIYE